jgi:hypothetical protein
VLQDEIIRLVNSNLGNLKANPEKEIIWISKNLKGILMAKWN